MSEEGDILAYLKLAKAVMGFTANSAILAWKALTFKRGSSPGAYSTNILGAVFCTKVKWLDFLYFLA